MSLLESLRARLAQGKQFIPDVRTAVPLGFRGRPRIAAGACPAGCEACTAVCPTAAISLAPLAIDLGRCTLCNECVAVCPEHKLELTTEPRMGATSREALELNATANVNFDLQRYGIEWVASPRHADALVLSGALTRNMQDAVRLAWDAMPEPRFVVAVGACAISGGLYDGARGVARGFLDAAIPALYVPGCPPHPLTFVNAILDLLGVA